MHRLPPAPPAGGWENVIQMNRGSFRPIAARSVGQNRRTTAAIVGSLFFPRSVELGLAVEDTVSPRVLAKMVHAGTAAISFAAATRDLAHLADLSISDERVRRACQRIGSERIEHHQRMQRAFEDKLLPEQAHAKPDGVEPPQIACVMCDGGRYQLLDRSLPRESRPSARKGDHWKESRIGLLVSMSGSSHACDPQPTLPPELRYEGMADKLSEIGRTGRAVEMPEESGEDDPLAAGRGVGLVGPTLERRNFVASRQSWEEFGPLLASQAWYRGFAAARRKVFVSDGSATIEKLHRTHFSHYTSILDLLHALSYSLAAARVVNQNEAAARDTYNRWAAKIWAGNVGDVIDELLAWCGKLGTPPEDAPKDDPRAVVRTSLVYYENHADRMDYPSYRRAGLPLTSSLMESAVKQISRRVKGTEKFWSSTGGETILRLRGEALSDDEPLRSHFQNRARHATGTRTYRARD